MNAGRLGRIGSAIFIFMLSVNGYARDDIQAWQWLSLNLWEQGAHKIHFYGDNRVVGDVSREKLWIGSLRYKYAAHEHLQLGFGYSYLDVHDLDADTWIHQQRVEFELNPKCTIGDNWKVYFRNRLETRFIEDKGDADFRSRHRVQIIYALKRGMISKFYTNTEVFYLYERNLLNEFRTVPAGLGLKLNKSTGLDLFYMIQSTRSGSSASWSHSHVFGTHLIHTF